MNLFVDKKTPKTTTTSLCPRREEKEERGREMGQCRGAGDDGG